MGLVEIWFADAMLMSVNDVTVSPAYAYVFVCVLHEREQTVCVASLLSSADMEGLNIFL